MADHNCPMCGNPNPEGTEICVHCGARLVPLEAGPSEDQSESTDWMDRMREEAEAVSSATSEPEPAGFSDFDPEAADFNLIIYAA